MGPTASAARAVMASRSSGGAASGERSLWGGIPAGTSSSLSSFRYAAANLAASMWPRWMGLKVPP